MADTSPPNPATSMLWFVVLTSVYFPIKYYTRNATQKMIYGGIYILLLIVGEFFINLTLTDAMCGSNQWGTALMVTLVPWVAIFGILNLLLLTLPGWLSPFSNTFGYAVARISGLSNLMNDILKPKIISKDLPKGSNLVPVQEALAHIYSDKSLLINEVTQTNFDKFWDNMSAVFKPGVKDNSSLKQKLLDMVRLKDIVAEYVWYMLTGFLVTSVGYNYVVSSGCTQSVQEMQKRHDQYEKDEEAKLAADKDSGPKRVYSTNE
jgi:hypothetical protein|tara:strand:- start:40 stop:828 length:789 start_codon:yes stop_codon:yes gene_type:complete